VNYPIAMNIIFARLKPCIVLTVAISLALSSWTNSALAEESANLLEFAYKANDYSAAANLAREQLKENPKNALAHYYLANSLFKLKQYGEAVEEYKQCIVLGKGSQIESNARQGLKSCSQFSLASDRPSAVLTTPPVMAASRSNEEVALSSFKEKVRLETEQKRHDLLEACKKEKKMAQERFDQTVKHIRSENRGDSEETIKSTIQSAFEKYSSEESQITERYQKQVDQLLKSSTVMADPKRNQQGSSRLVPGSSGIYVQSFENLGDEDEAVNIPSENPMKATAGKLGASGTMTNRQKGFSKGKVAK